MEAQGLVWAWGEGGKDAELEARMTPPLLVPEIEGVGKSGEAPGGKGLLPVHSSPVSFVEFMVVQSSLVC